MANFGKLSLFSYLLDNKELLKLDEDKNVNVSSPEALAILTALSFHENPRKMFFLFPTIYEAEAFNQFLGDYLDEDETYMFPYDEIFRSSTIGVSPEMADERLLAVGSIFSNKPSILVAHASSVSLDIMPKERYLNHLLKIKNGDMFVVKDLVLKLTELGYLAVDRVAKANQFSLRGGILDIYDASFSYPVRIEFF